MKNHTEERKRTGETNKKRIMHLRSGQKHSEQIRITGDSEITSDIMKMFAN